MIFCFQTIWSETMQHSDVYVEPGTESSDSRSASSYGLCSLRTDSDTASIIQTSARQQKEIDAMFFSLLFLSTQSGVYLPCESLLIHSNLHFKGICLILIRSLILSFINQDFMKITLIIVCECMLR